MHEGMDSEEGASDQPCIVPPPPWRRATIPPSRTLQAPWTITLKSRYAEGDPSVVAAFNA
jgi:hypothetical protein